MGSIGTVDPILAVEAKHLFESRCVEMLKWAAFTLKTTKTITPDWGEENITANIYTLIHNSQQAIDYDIYAECEHPFFDQDILDNKKKAKAAVKIDMAFQHNWNRQKFSFYIEAKNLIETDVKKTGRKHITKAVDVMMRYVTTGIDHYVDEYYPQGCMLGYVLNGTIAGVVSVMNSMLVDKGRSSDVLDNPSGVSPWMSFQSQHAGVQIMHYLFNFC